MSGQTQAGADLTHFVRSPETDRALDALLARLYERGFGSPDVDPAECRDALAGALVDTAIDDEIRIRINKEKT